MSEAALLFENRDGVAWLTMNRPEAMNSISLEMITLYEEYLEQILGDECIKVVVISGAGKAFCAGADLKQVLDSLDVPPGKPDFLDRLCDRVLNPLRDFPKPVIAALNGIAAGGGFQIALVSDQRVAHPGVRMGQPEINAAIPSIMGSYWMSLHLGWSKNQELSMTGRLMDAGEAHDLGLINHLVEPDQVIAKACKVAETLAAKPAVAWARTKARFREIALSGFDEAFRAGVLGQQESYAKGEAQAVIEAFLSSRSSGQGGGRDDGKQ